VDGGVPVGTQLTNTVEITTANDSDTGNNWHQRNDVWVGEPRWDGFFDKTFGWGTLVPGGQVEYNLHARNFGNMATYTVVTDTLPAGTSFDQSQSCNGSTCVPFPPDYVDDQIAVWDLGTLEPGEWVNWSVRLAIDGDAEPGTVFTNCGEVVVDGDDSQPYNNTDCVAEMVYDFGPNLRIDKYYQWNWEGQLEYTIDFSNIGTTTLHDVEIADTLPADTTFSGNWWHWFWQGIDFNQVGDQLIWTISQLDPTWSSGLRYQVDLDGDIVGQEGLCFTNAAAAPIAGDVYPDNNYDQVTACTGPDVYVEKWLSGGEPKLGDIVTFTVEFGNKDRWPWNGDDQYGSHITDTLPAGMTFITATAPWNPDDRWQPESVDGNTIVWGWGPMWADSWWRFDIVAQITGPVEDGDVLVNTVEAYGDSPNDVEPDYDNNVFDLPVTILAPSLQVAKTYQTTGIGGSVVTYTLTVTNIGSSDATHVVLSDTLPAGLTYGSGDGSFDGTDVTWTIATVASGGGTATAWFRATLPAEGTVTNAAYRVVSSDQGASSAFGPPVSFAVTVANYYLYLPIVLKNHTP
jgi:large repetitive protein